jgi:hypothetical protein
MPIYKYALKHQRDLTLTKAEWWSLPSLAPSLQDIGARFVKCDKISERYNKLSNNHVHKSENDTPFRTFLRLEIHPTIRRKQILTVFLLQRLSVYSRRNLLTSRKTIINQKELSNNSISATTCCHFLYGLGNVLCSFFEGCDIELHLGYFTISLLLGR